MKFIWDDTYAEIGMYNMLPNFNDAKRRASWFIENGYGQND